MNRGWACIFFFFFCKISMSRFDAFIGGNGALPFLFCVIVFFFLSKWVTQLEGILFFLMVFSPWTGGWDGMG